MEIKILDPRITLEMFQPAKLGDAGFDLRACIDEPLVLRPGESKLIPVGFSINIENTGLVGVAVPRSGSGVKGLVLGNLIGIIDSGYQGPVKVCLWNRTIDQFERPIIIHPMDRVAQFILTPVFHAEFQFVEEFTNISVRGFDGFGSSGVK